MRLLRVTVDDQTEMTAGRAKLLLSIEGETFVMGNAALERSREVRELVAALQQAGLAATDIHVQGVKIASASGLIARNQRVEFNLAVDVTPALLPQVLGVVSAQKNLKLRQLDWHFDGFEASIPLTAQAMKKARRKADAIAGAAGHTVTGIHNASDSWDMPVANVNLGMNDTATSGLMMRSRAAEPLDIGVEYRATQPLNVHLTVDFTLE